MRICYCDKCGLRIPEPDIQSGAATIAKGQNICAKCAGPVAAPAEREAVRAPTQKMHVPLQTPARPPKQRTAVVPKQTKSNSVLLAGAGVAAVMLLGLAFFMLQRNRAPKEAVKNNAVSSADPAPKVTPTSTTPNAAPVVSKPEGDPRAGGLFNSIVEKKADDAPRRLQEIKAWAIANPEEPAEYREKLTTFSAEFRATPSAAEANKILGEIKPVSRINRLLARWPLDDNKGTTAASSGSTQAVLKGRSTWAPGRSGAAVDVPENGSYVDLGQSPNINFAADSAFSICGWFKTRDGYGPTLSFRNSDNDQPVIDVMVGFDGKDDLPGRLIALVRTDGGDPLVNIAGGQVSDERWHHFTVMREKSGMIKLYLNGALQSEGTVPGMTRAITTNMRMLGLEARWEQDKDKNAETQKAYDDNRRYLNAQFSDLRVYGFALLPAEVSELAR